MTSAFLIQVQPQLQPDTGEETTALLRVLIHKIDNTTPGDNVPTIPQWPGPPRATVNVQAILYASLAASLLSAFLAMLGKQWLNRYASIDVRGSATERSRNRQRKLDGVVAWYFDHVMESLPLMLQIVLLLLGCALSLHLWGIDTTVASVVLGVTSFGVVFYVFVVIAGTASVSCPYQTPSAQILRHIQHILLPVLSKLRLASSSVIKKSTLVMVWRDILNGLECSREHVTVLLISILLSPIILFIDLATNTYLLMRGIVRAFDAVTCRVYRWLCGVPGVPPQTDVLDLQCIMWMLKTSLDRAVQLLTLKLLTTTTTLANPDPSLVSAFFDILAGCVSVVGGKAVIAPVSEELTAASARCFLHTLSHSTAMDPKSSVFTDMQRRYTRTFPIDASFEDLPSYHRFCIIHNIFHPLCDLSPFHGRYPRRPKVQWEGYKPSGSEHTVLTRFARSEYQRKKPRKVPRWILR